MLEHDTMIEPSNRIIGGNRSCYNLAVCTEMTDEAIFEQEKCG